jgi:hypothetical protein
MIKNKMAVLNMSCIGKFKMLKFEIYKKHLLFI